MKLRFLALALAISTVWAAVDMRRLNELDTMKRNLVRQVPCTYTPTNGPAAGHTFDLSDLQGVSFGTSDVNYFYKLAVCGVHAEDKCASNQGGLCQYSTLGFVHTLMSWTLNTPNWNLLNPNDKNSGLTVQYANGDICYNMGQRGIRIVNLNFPCDPNAGRTGSRFLITNPPSQPCMYNVNFPTAVTCYDYVSSGSGLSTMGILFIVALFFIPVYVGGGCFYKRRRLGVEGWEACPNVDFWRGLPQLLKDCGGGILTRIRTCGRGETSDGI